MECALFYPRVVPPKSWIKQSLLYWDVVGSVVHRDFWDDPDPDIAWLAERGHYETAQVDDLSREAAKQVADEFIDVLASLEERGISWEPGNGPHESINYGKLPMLVELQMKELGVLREAREGLTVNRRLLAPFIAILAKHACLDFSSPGRSYSLHTDDPESQTIALLPTSAEQGRRQALEFTLQHVLPVPDESVSFDAILRFRQEHEANLSLLRSLLTKNVRDGLRDGLTDLEILADATAAIQKEQFAMLRSIRRTRMRFWLATSSVIAVTGVGLAVDPQSTQWVMAGLGTAIFSMMPISTRNDSAPDFSYLHDARQALSCQR